MINAFIIAQDDMGDLYLGYYNYIVGRSSAMVVSVHMDIYWYGQACFKVKGKTASFLIDPYDPDMMGFKAPKPSEMEVDVVLKTHDHPDHNNLSLAGGNPVEIIGPGEYEVKGVTINGVSVFHDKTQGSERGKNTIYNILIDGLNIVHCGDLGHTLTEEQIQEIGECDILMIPIGSIYTIDGKDAAEVVSELEPRIIIPMHYKIPGMKFELEGVDTFLKEMGAEGIEPQPKLSITKDKLPDEPQVVLLNKN